MNRRIKKSTKTKRSYSNKSSKRKSSRKSSKRNSSKRKSSKRNSSKRKSSKRNSSKRKSPKRKSSKKSSKRKSPISNFKSASAKKIYSILKKKYGTPTIKSNKPNGLCIWYNKLPFEKIELRDEEIQQCTPKKDIGFLYHYIKIFIPRHKILGVHKISDSLSYDPLKKELYARSSSIEANYAIFKTVIEVLTNKSINQSTPEGEANIDKLYTTNLNKMNTNPTTTLKNITEYLNTHHTKFNTQLTNNYHPIGFKTGCPTKVTSVPKKVTSVPKKVVSTPKKVVSTPKKVVSTPKKVTPVPKKVTPVPKKVEPAPKKVEPAPKKVTPVPKKVTPVPAPVPKKVTPAPKKVVPTVNKILSSPTKLVSAVPNKLITKPPNKLVSTIPNNISTMPPSTNNTPVERVNITIPNK